MTNKTTFPPAWVNDWLSAPRLASYQAVAGSKALDLYKWNGELGAAFFEIVGWFEVCWRNAIDNAITTRRPATAKHWLFDPAFPLQSATRTKVTRAIRAIQRRGSNIQPNAGQIIAELTLGFWRFSTKAYLETIWVPYLQNMFPYANRKPSMRTVNKKLIGIIEARNRIAHHEPLFERIPQLRQVLADLLDLGRWINPEASDWWRQSMTIEQVLGKDPRKNRE